MANLTIEQKIAGGAVGLWVMLVSALFLILAVTVAAIFYPVLSAIMAGAALMGVVIAVFLALLAGRGITKLANEVMPAVQLIKNSLGLSDHE